VIGTLVIVSYTFYRGVPRGFLDGLSFRIADGWQQLVVGSQLLHLECDKRGWNVAATRRWAKNSNLVVVLQTTLT